MPNSNGSSPERRSTGRHDPLLPGMKLEELGQTLAQAYDDVLAQGVPAHLSHLLPGATSAETRDGRRPAHLALVVEDDRNVRALAETVIDETPLDVIGCETAERALDVLRDHEGEVALVFADINLAGEMDGVQLAQTVFSRWPETRVVLTSGAAPEQPGDIPEQAVFIAKPWRPFDVLVQAERAVTETGRKR